MTWKYLKLEIKIQVSSCQDRKTNLSVCFLGEFTARQFFFRDLLTFSMKLQLRVYRGFNPNVSRIGGSKAFWCPKCKDERSFLNVGSGKTAV